MAKKPLQFKTKTSKKEYLASLIDSDKSVPVTYDMSTKMEVGQFIEHPKFGLGFIHSVINDTKVEVFFETSERVLLQNYQIK